MLIIEDIIKNNDNATTKRIKAGAFMAVRNFFSGLVSGMKVPLDRHLPQEIRPGSGTTIDVSGGACPHPVLTCKIEFNSRENEDQTTPCILQCFNNNYSVQLQNLTFRLNRKSNRTM